VGFWRAWSMVGLSSNTVACVAAGSPLQEEVKPADRKGALWDFYNKLVVDGWTPDVHSYSTSFRCKAPLQHQDRAALACIPQDSNKCPRRSQRLCWLCESPAYTCLRLFYIPRPLASRIFIAGAPVLAE
jgi:hypothetical protein